MEDECADSFPRNRKPRATEVHGCSDIALRQVEQLHSIIAPLSRLSCGSCSTSGSTARRVWTGPLLCREVHRRISSPRAPLFNSLYQFALDWYFRP